MIIAALANTAGIMVSPHGAADLSVHLAVALPNALHVENIFDPNLFDFSATSTPLAIEDGRYAPGVEPGHGVVLDFDALAAHELTPGKPSTGSRFT